MKTEIDEYLRGAEITDVLAIWEDKIKSSGLVLYEKGRGRIEVLGNVPKNNGFNRLLVSLLNTNT